MPEFIKEWWGIWVSGGSCMIPLFIISVAIFVSIARLFIFFNRCDYKHVPEATWSRWISNPSEGQGLIGRIIQYSQDGAESLDDVGNRFAEIMGAEIPQIDRRIVFLAIMVNMAPLLGLLGTVLGMLDTFKVISAGGGSTIDLVANGIRVALITTQAGLTIAIPGVFLTNIIKRKRNMYVAFLVRLESLTLQHMQRKLAA